MNPTGPSSGERFSRSRRGSRLCGGATGPGGSERPADERARPGGQRQGRLRSARAARICATASSASRCPRAFVPHVQPGRRECRTATTCRSRTTAWASSTWPDGRFRLVRNHEDRNNPGQGSTALDAACRTTSAAGGGTTTVVVNPFTRQLERDFVSVSGTTVNCAGGVTPWDSWVTCEETNVGPNAAGTSWPTARLLLRRPGRRERPGAGGRAVRTWAASRTKRSPSIRTPGSSTRPKTTATTAASIASSRIRRACSRRRPAADAGGRGQSTSTRGSPRTSACRCDVDVDRHRQSQPGGHELDRGVRQGLNRGRVRFRRLEGCWWGNGAIYFVATNGGTCRRRSGVGVPAERRRRAR